MARMSMFFYIVAITRDVQAILEQPAGSMMFRFLSVTLSVLAAHWHVHLRVALLAAALPLPLLGLVQTLQLGHTFYTDRCTYDTTAEPKIMKKYKLVCTGPWLEAACQKCTCTGQHIQLMVTKHLEDGRSQKTGVKPLMAESGMYPPRMGAAIVQAWQGRSAWKHPLQGLRPGKRATPDVWGPSAAASQHGDPWQDCPQPPMPKACKAKCQKAQRLDSLHAHDPWTDAPAPDGPTDPEQDPWAKCETSFEDDPWKGVV